MARVKIIVDSVEIEVESKNNLIDELKKYNIDIPHFCYNKALGVDGNCRMCLIELQGAKRPQIACDTPIKEGMEIITKSDSVKRLRSSLLELFFLNHPLDCSVCDQVGECYLQEYYMKYDLESSRLEVEKVKKDKRVDFNNGVVYDGERCVVCTRCVRFCRDITKTNELGVITRGDKSQIAVFPNLKTPNRYAQNIVDLCPVGALTSKDFRFKRRVYFLKSCESICHGCAKGCNIYIDHQKKKYTKSDFVYRFRPRYNEEINSAFMCDFGRESYRDENETLEVATIESKEITIDEAINKAKEYLNNSLFLVSPNCNLEEMKAILNLAKEYNSKVSGYSNSSIKDDGDDFLIQNDKAVNRKGLEAFNISENFDELKNDLAEAQNIFIFDSKEPIYNGELKELIKNKNIINLTSKSDELIEFSKVVIPIASFSKKSGTIINCDGIKQRYESNLISKSLELVEVISKILDKNLNI